jgi:hypothetical protein
MRERRPKHFGSTGEASETERLLETDDAYNADNAEDARLLVPPH